MRRSPGGGLRAGPGRAWRRPGRAASGGWERWVPRRCVDGAARTPPTSTRQRPGTPGPAARQAALRRSAPRQPRAPTHLLDQRPQDVVVEGELADLALRVGELALLHRPRAALQALLAALQERLTPPADRP